MKRIALLAALLAALPLGRAAAMDVATFLVKAEALEQGGAMALLSGEVRAVMGEVKAATAALRAERLAAVEAGQRPAYCPPEKGGLDRQELLAGMREVPAEERPRTDSRDAMKAALARKFPCG